MDANDRWGRPGPGGGPEPEPGFGSGALTPPPPTQPPAGGPPPPGAGLRAVAAGLLNLSGAGLGHVMVRRWGRAAVSWGATGVLLLVALPADPDGVPAFLIAVYLVVIVLASADAARIAVRTDIGRWPRPILAAVLGLVLLAAPLTGTVFYGSARDEAVERELLAQLDEADDLVAKASKSPFALSQVDYRYALTLYGELSKDHPESRAAQLVPKRLEAYYDAVSAPYREKLHCEAVQPLTYLRTVPGTVDPELLGDLVGRPDTPLAESLYACGVSRLNGTGTGSGSTELSTLLRTFPESSQAGQVGPAISARIQQQVSALKGDAPCEVTEDLRRMSTMTAALPSPSVSSLSLKADAGVRDGVYTCGVAEFKDKQFTKARQTLTGFADTYKKDRRRQHAQDIAIAAEIADERPSAGKRLPPSGKPGGSRMELVISNDAPNEVEVLYTGPVTGTVKLKSCGSCERYSSAASGSLQACKASGKKYPKVRLQLPAGEYHFLYKHGTGTTSAVDSYTSGSRVEPRYTYTGCTYVIAQGRYGLDLPSLPDPLRPASAR